MKSFKLSKLLHILVMKNSTIVIAFILALSSHFIFGQGPTDNRSFEVLSGPFIDLTNYVPPPPLDNLSGIINITNFKQCDGSWGNNFLGTCSATICQSGCAMTAATILLEANGVNVNPGQLNPWLRNNGGYSNGCDIDWATAANYPSATPTFTYIGRAVFSLSTLRSEIDGGNPVIVHVDHRYGGTGTCGHFPVIYGYNNAGTSVSDFLISDPGTVTCPIGCNLSLYTVCSQNEDSTPLRLFHGVTAPAPDCPSPSSIVIGQTIPGTLQSGDCRRPDTSYYDAYTFSGTAGQQIYITLNSSQFNAFLFLFQGSYPGGTLRASNNDGGGGTNARIPATSGFFTLPTSGTYTILANSLAAGESGSYSLFLGGPDCSSPGAFSLNAPSNGQSLSSTTSTTLSWGASPNADSYDVYFGTNSNPPFLANQTGTSRTVVVTPGQTYWWKVVAKSNCTGATSTTPTWSFSIQQACNAPGTFSLTSPSNGQSLNSTTSVDLTWGASANANSYDVYFGTSSNPPLIANQPGRSRTVTVTPGQTYWWKIVARLSCGAPTSTTAIWSFSVQQSACTYSISPEVTIQPGTGYVEFGMVATAGCAWSAVSDSPWLTTSSSGSGNGTVHYDYIANPNPSPRIGHITMGGQVHTVTQLPLGGTGVVRFNAGNYEMNESIGTARIGVIRLSGTGPGTVQYSTSDGTALGGLDYVPTFGTLSFDEGVTLQFIDVVILEDNLLFEANETFTLSLSDPSASFILGNPSTTTATIINNPIGLRRPFDYDGDGKADLSVYRPSNGLWFIDNSGGGGFVLQLGNSTDKIAPADFDGDGKTDVAVYRQASGTWYLYNSATSTYTTTGFGIAEDLPAPGDYDGDGKADIAIYRPSTGTWWLNRSTAGLTAIQFGLTGDIPVPGDFDGDGKADLVVFRPSNGVWYMQRSSAGGYAIQFGNSTDKIVPADYDGDGKMDVAIYRPSQGTWYSVNSSNGGYPVQVFGLSTDIPVPGDYDGDGKADVAIFRPSNGQWWLNRTTSGLTVTQFGSTGDKPTPNAFGN